MTESRAAEQPANSGASATSRWCLWTWATVAVIVAQIGLSLHFATTASVTHDEYWHLPVGSLHWRTGRFDWEPLNPPLARAWAGLPVSFMDQMPVPDKPIPPGEYGDRFVAAHPQSFHRLYVAGRCMAILATALTTLLMACWAHQMAGPIAGFAAAVLWGLNPNTISHGTLVTTDMGAALAFVAVLWSLWRFAEVPTWRRAITLGVLLGLAQGIKYTCVLLYGIAPLVWWLMPRPRPAGFAPRQTLIKSVAALAISLVMLNIAYLGEQSFKPLKDFSFQSQAMQGIARLLNPLQQVPLPVPATFLKGLDAQQHVIEQAHPVYLDGQWTTSGFRDFYLKALLYKQPLGLLVLAAFALVAVVLLRSHWRLHLVLLIPTLLLIGIASLQSMQLGLRYILPSLALGTLAIAISVGHLASRHAVSKWLVGGLLLVSLEGVTSHPYELAYFNQIAGGPDEGYLHLIDSNVDWGQDLDTLKTWLDEHDSPPITLAYFGTVDPRAVGIEYRLPPSNQPAPGWHAVSVSFVAGRPHAVRDGQGETRSTQFGEFAYFRFLQPETILGHSIALYHLSEQDVAEWHRQMSSGR